FWGRRWRSLLHLARSRPQKTFRRLLADAIALPDTCSPVHHPERAVVVRAELDPVCGPFIEVRNSLVREVFSAGSLRAVHLPHIFQSLHLTKAREHLRLSTFCRAVVEDRHPRLERSECCRVRRI